MNIKKIAGALGAEISGVDLAKGVPHALAAEIRQVFLAHQVIFLRGQKLHGSWALVETSMVMAEAKRSDLLICIGELPLILGDHGRSAKVRQMAKT